jgi:hypothetical protein
MMQKVDVPIRYSIPQDSREYHYAADLNIEGYADKWRDAIWVVLHDQSIECPTLHEFWMSVRDIYFANGGQYILTDETPSMPIEYGDS